MSIIFGFLLRSGEVATNADLDQMSVATAPYAPDGTFVALSGRVGMGKQPYYTNARSRLDPGPCRDAVGNIVVFDGRLDNFEEMQRLLNISDRNLSDAAIVLQAYGRWRQEAFSRLIGEWALALWSAKEDALYLARDHAGTRTLYFSNTEGSVRWSTYLEGVVSDKSSGSVSQEYLGRYIANQQLDSLTPYRYIQSVRAAECVVKDSSGLSAFKHWSSIARDEIHYGTESDYVDQFLELFGRSVARRTGPGTPVIAELSGGMDSSSIVCMSDHIKRREGQAESLLHTISYYDDSEPSWDEKPYFSAVEIQRGRTGVHLSLSSLDRTFLPAIGEHGTYLLPGADSSLKNRELALKSELADRGYRVVLSGIGGDEVTGGNPDPLPELASYLSSGELRSLLRKTTEWCLVKREPLFHMLFKAAVFTRALNHCPRDAYRVEVPPWVNGNVLGSLGDDLLGSADFRRDANWNPINVCNFLAWESILSTLPTLNPLSIERYEYRYPFLDRELDEYLFGIPRTLLVRPGRRRYLMRKALAGIVPAEIIERKRKAFVARGHVVSLRTARDIGRVALKGRYISEVGVIDQKKFASALELVLRGEDLRWMGAIIRTINADLWLAALLGESTDIQTNSVDRIPRRVNGANRIRRGLVAS